MPTEPKYERSLPARALGFGAATIAAIGLIGSTTAQSAAPSDASAKGNQVGEGYVFPVPGKHEYGDGFGAGRGHDGQDIFAKCGQKLVAAHDGKVQMAQFDDSGYGNIFVLDVKGTGVDLLYAHMRKKAIPKVGDKVDAGEKIGEVGATGNAQGCHLHFEMHTAPGFWEGGHAMRSVTRYLKEWDKES